MTLASTGALTATQIQTELGLGSFNMDRTAERNLAGRPSGAYSWSDFNGQTSGGSCAVSDITAFADTVTGTATMAGVQFGAVAWNRYIVCTVIWSCMSNAVSTTILSATIGGVPAAALVQNAANGSSAVSNYGCAIIRALVPTGTSGTVQISFSNGTVRRCYISAYRVTGWQTGLASNVATAFDESILGPGLNKPSAQSAITLASNSALFVVGVISEGPSPPTTLTFTGATERADSGGAFNDRLGHAMSFPLGAQSSRPVGVAAANFIDASRARMCAACFQLF